MSEQRASDELGRVLRSVAGEPLVILISGHPDPDALGSALAHQYICRHLDVPATIAHVLDVSHRQNRALVKLLNIEMIQVRAASSLARFKNLSLVDTSSPEPTIDLPADLRLLSVVDHHHVAGAVQAPFVDVRRNIGATSSIYAEYLSQGLAPVSDDRNTTRMATALLFGIQTDTDDFARATPADFRAAAYVKERCDMDVLKQIGPRTIGATAMAVLGRALSSLEVIRDFALAGVGTVSLADRDAIGSAADYILRREDIDTVLVFGIVGDRIDGSLRTNSPSVDPATFLLKAFGTDRNGSPYGGGRADKGGFQIPLGLLGECEDSSRLWTLVEQAVRLRIGRIVPELLIGRFKEANKSG